MLTRLPNLIDPLLLAERNAAIAGQLPLTDFERLAEVLAETQGNVTIDIVFGKDGSRAKIEGKVSAALTLVCQRCLEPLPWQVDKEIKLGVVQSLDQADKLPEGFEPLLLEDDKVALKTIIEDELLLSIPDAPKHNGACRIPDLAPGKVIEAENNANGTTQNPFSILADIKFTGENNGSTKK